MYAVIRAGGKQYRVAPGDVIRLENQGNGTDGKIEFNDVLAVSGEPGQIANASRDFMRIGHNQIPPYGYNSRKITPLQSHFHPILTSMSCTLSRSAV